MKLKKKFKFENLIGGKLLLLLGEDLDERAESFPKREIYTLPSQNRGAVDAIDCIKHFSRFDYSYL